MHGWLASLGVIATAVASGEFCWGHHSHQRDSEGVRGRRLVAWHEAFAERTLEVELVHLGKANGDFVGHVDEVH